MNFCHCKKKKNVYIRIKHNIINNCLSISFFSIRQAITITYTDISCLINSSGIVCATDMDETSNSPGGQLNRLKNNLNDLVMPWYYVREFCTGIYHMSYFIKCIALIHIFPQTDSCGSTV